jgi:hypothetical protein
VRRRPSASSHVLAVVVALSMNATALAQQGRGAVHGTVTDTSGAGVPNAEITLTHIATQTTFTARTGREGYYIAPAVSVGDYLVTAERTGFKLAVRAGVAVEVDRQVRVDFQLAVGDFSERVDVVERVPRTETSGATLGKVVEHRQLAELPVNGRNVLALVLLAPGVKSNAGPTQSGFADRGIALSAVSINGGPGGLNSYLLDGGTNNQAYLADINVSPTTEAVREFKVQSNTMSSEFGFTAGGVVNAVTKSGTNGVQGTLYGFVRDDRFDARNAFATAVAPFGYYQTGASLGGPVVIPGVFQGRDRTFFFFNAERWRYTRVTNPITTVPTEAMRRGDFSALRDAAGNRVLIYDPATTRPNPDGPGFVRDPFPGNRIPANRLDPVAQNIVSFYPSPNRVPENPFTGDNNYAAALEENRSMRQWTARVDHQWSPRNSSFARYLYYRHFTDSGGDPVPWPDPVLRQRLDTLTAHNIVVSDTHVFGSGVLNELRVARAGMHFPFQPLGFGQGWPQRLGLPASVPADTFPRIDNGFAGFNTSTAGLRTSATWQVVDMLTAVRGSHTLKFGADVRVQRAYNLQRSNPSGRFTFPASLTGDPQRLAGSGSAFATFLLGAVGTATVTTHLPQQVEGYSTSGFVQDDWRVSRRLTLNLGLRYDYQAPPVERDDFTSNFNPFAVDPVSGFQGRLEFAGRDYGRAVLLPDRNDWGPRVGFACDVLGNARYVVRGGYGIFYPSIFYRDFFGNTAGFGTTTTTYQPEGGNANVPAFEFSRGFPSPPIAPLGAALGPSGLLGGIAAYDEPSGRNPMSQQWTVSLQHEVGRGVALEAAYTGNRSTHLVSRSYDLNALDPDAWSLGLALQDQVPNPNAGRVPGSLGANLITRAQALKPFPHYNQVLVRNPHQGRSDYHALLLSADKRFSAGVAFLASYTFARLMSDNVLSPINFGSDVEQIDVNDYQDGKHARRAEWGLDPTDVRHRLSVSGVYELPFGAGRRWPVGNPVLRSLVSDWHVSAILVAQGGLPLVVRCAERRCGDNLRADRPNYLGHARVAHPTAQRWFDTTAFVSPPGFTLGDVGRTMSDVRTPGVVNMDLAVTRTVQVRRRARLHFRAEAFNLTNRVNLRAPDTTFVAGPDGRNVNSSFGTITAARDARILQFAVRLAF